MASCSSLCTCHAVLILVKPINTSRMAQLQAQLRKARTSGFHRWLLNVALHRVVPFNRPHSIRITAVTDDELRMVLPFKRANRNHIGGMHACAMATMCEYICGLSLLTHLSPKEYRIVLKNIHMTYHYQAKGAVKAKFRLTQEMVQTEILTPMMQVDAVFKEFQVDVFDEEEQHICTGLINWQIKPWAKVRTKLKS